MDSMESIVQLSWLHAFRRVRKHQEEAIDNYYRFKDLEMVVLDQLDKYGVSPTEAEEFLKTHPDGDTFLERE